MVQSKKSAAGGADEEALKDDLLVPLDYKHVEEFLHCRACVQDFYAHLFGNGQSPREALSYELSSYPFQTQRGVKERIFVAWCKRCGGSVWDSRHLRPK